MSWSAHSRGRSSLFTLGGSFAAFMLRAWLGGSAGWARIIKSGDFGHQSHPFRQIRLWSHFTKLGTGPSMRIVSKFLALPICLILTLLMACKATRHTDGLVAVSPSPQFTREQTDSLIAVWRSPESTADQRVAALRALLPVGTSAAEAKSVLGDNAEWAHWHGQHLNGKDDNWVLQCETNEVIFQVFLERKSESEPFDDARVAGVSYLVHLLSRPLSEGKQ